MKNKKSLLGLGLLALVLVLGVGYAVVSSVDLTFKGTAEGVADAKLNVVIESISPESNDKVGHAGDDTSDTFSIKDMKLNDTVTMVYTIRNKETDVNANLVDHIALENDNEEYFDASYTIDNPVIPAGQTTTVTVTVTMKKTPVVAENNLANISFTLKANPVDNANN